MKGDYVESGNLCAREGRRFVSSRIWPMEWPTLTDYKLSGPIFTLSTFQSPAPLSPLARGTAAGGHDRLVK